MNKQQVLNKWAPILENYGYRGKKMKEMSCYCESHCIDESFVSTQTTFGGIKLDPIMENSTLPLSVKILSAVYNLNNYDNILFVSGQELEKKTYIAEYVISNELNDVLSKGDLIEFVEEQLVRIIAKEIGNVLNELCMIKNEKMSDYERMCIPGTSINSGNIIIFNANYLVKSVQLISEGTLAPKMFVKYTYGVKSTGNTSLISELETVRHKISDLQSREKELVNNLQTIK